MANYCSSIHNLVVGAHTQIVIGVKIPSFEPHFWLLACNTTVTEASKKNIANKAWIERMSLNFNIFLSNLKYKTNYQITNLEFKQYRSNGDYK